MPAVLATLLLAACASSLSSPPGRDPSAPEPAGDVALRDAFAGRFRVGSAVNAAIVSGDDAAANDLVLRHFGSITPENVMKAEVLHPEPGRWDFSAADAFVAFGEAHGLHVVGHTLVWHNQTPPWFFTDDAGRPNTPEAQLARMCDYIATVAGRYAGRVHAWDVVNEVIGEDGSYRDTAWVRAVGDGDALVRRAFACAARHAPDAELYYNDFNTWRPEKRAGIVRLVRMLQDAGIRIDGVGMQGHWGLNYPTLAEIEASIDAYAALGVKVMITELDVDVLPFTREGQVIGTAFQHPQFQLPEFRAYLDPYRDGLPPEVDARLAARYAELFELFVRKQDVIDRVTVWGVHDGMSWKNGYPVPGRTNHPLLFDRAYRPKTALRAVLDVAARTPR